MGKLRSVKITELQQLSCVFAHPLPSLLLSILAAWTSPSRRGGARPHLPQCILDPGWNESLFLTPLRALHVQRHREISALFPCRPSASCLHLHCGVIIITFLKFTFTFFYKCPEGWNPMLSHLKTNIKIGTEEIFCGRKLEVGVGFYKSATKHITIFLIITCVFEAGYSIFWDLFLIRSMRSVSALEGF